MPNHIQNRLVILGTPEQVDEIYEKYSTFHPSVHETDYQDRLIYKNEDGEYGWYDEEKKLFHRRDKEPTEEIPLDFAPSKSTPYIQFPDFEKVIPTPDGLDIESNGDLMPLENRFSSRQPFKDTVDKLREGLKRYNDEEGKEDRIKNFLQGIENYIRHGHATWYSWNAENWGTKWNSYESERISDNVFEWQTAWAGVPHMIIRISEKFPEVEMEYLYADEDTGCNVGRFKIKGGEVIENTSPANTTKEAYELAFELRPDYKDDFVLVGDTYKYKEDEEEVDG